MDDDNFSEAFLKANANEPFIAAQFAEFIRNILRSTITSGYSNQKYAAVDNLKFCFALLRNAEQVHFLDLVDQIIEDLEVPDDRQRTDSFGRAVLRASKSGTQVLIERTCKDGAAKARASRRESEFLQAIRN